MRSTAYLVIRPDQTLRIAKRPRLSNDEVAIKINLDFPPSWGRIVGELDVTVPDFTPEVSSEGEAFSDGGTTEED